MMRRYTRATKNRYAEGDTPDTVAAKENTHLNNYLEGGGWCLINFVEVCMAEERSILEFCSQGVNLHTDFSVSRFLRPY